MRTEPESTCTGPGGPQPSGALPCPVERQRFVREDAGRRCVTAARLSALFCIGRFMQMRESIILRYKAAQHTKNRADVRKTEGTGKSRYRGEAARTIILGAVQACSLRVRGLPLCGPDARDGAGRKAGCGQYGRAGLEGRNGALFVRQSTLKSSGAAQPGEGTAPAPAGDAGQKQNPKTGV